MSPTEHPSANPIPSHDKGLSMLTSRLVVYVFLLGSLLFPPALAKNANLTQCLARVHDGSLVLPPNSTLDSRGNPTDARAAAAIPYAVCVRECGPYASKFDWTVFSTNFSTWLLPWLALISQLPFGSQHRQQNVMSVLLTLGSPALAAYALILCVLNWAWVPRAFEGINYPNVKSAYRVLGSFQHSPLYVEVAGGLLASVVVLPENDQWWRAIDEGLNYEETWTTAIVLQIAWVVVAFVFTVVGSFQDGIADDFQTSGRGTGTLFLWLLPLVVGWQRLSPRCDYVRVRDALWRANSEVYAAVSPAAPATPLSTSTTPSFLSPHSTAHTRQPSTAPSPTLKKCAHRFPFTLKHCTGDVGASAPIFSYSRLFPWSENVALVAGAFRAAAAVAAARDVQPGDADARRATLKEVARLVRSGAHVRPLDWSAVLRRCALAGALAMLVHWGAIGSAIVYSLYTPTTGLGCRSGSFLVYACAGMLVWLAMLASSLLTRHAEQLARQGRARRVTARSLSPKTLHMIADVVRRGAKLGAGLNAGFIVAACVALFSNLFTNCWCDASVISRGYESFTVIALLPEGDASIQPLNVAWGVAIAMSLGSVAIFIAFVYMHVNPVDPDPYFLYDPVTEAYRDEDDNAPSESHPAGEMAAQEFDPYAVDLPHLRAEGGHSPHPSASSSRKEY